nr:hypothetical protein [uncultured Campylobacter sp.]
MSREILAVEFRAARINFTPPNFKIPKFQNFAIRTSFANFVFRGHVKNSVPWNLCRKILKFYKAEFRSADFRGEKFYRRACGGENWRAV